MKIKWFGQSCFMITSQSGIKVLTDPYKKMLGYKLPEMEADIVSTSHNHSDHNNINIVKSSFIHINEPGNFLEHGIEIKGVQTFHDKTSGSKRGKNTIYNFKIDDINICHCGDLGHLLNSEQIEKIGNVDILLLPVGGLATLNAVDAVQVMKQLNPTIVIPMHYRTKALGIVGYVFGKVDKFISASELQVKEYEELELNKANIKGYSGIVVLKYD
ncbi:MBL fold metallo-hydrolase [Clostridium beijerinckii]|uniref:L-ascorbate metabolism protein UlaG (Beta-lactamase superfamily) n=1 Tax=Clostridium beijerinckii TaxID=1520 RepID=A0AAX0B2D0_CLOBE|nr:MBL fold metallo-hydrolase [Clostridium beijerinckii]NOW07901.1 L-ascorbate metabolism protein UlaG (beta-lactamase superfamily) [Clostridium beijerinckii]NRT33185.1 L-ascorbate metabolism protein UlaG (beta-lactamase superfamily) [Clostridium beijerinckii]NRT47389.1 L-ascorbate metabolism protein UlaG (beta-lactamase superfamily) [Clostridium beijerinckii]NRT89510.1 L-ascorbate metabolism protein UlaG (beta-lactamase superfamily) [Clostridium beijerinckii]NRZ18606.1 L-ascorbate metabolism 